MKAANLSQTSARRFAKRAQAAFAVVAVVSLAIAVWGSRPRSVPSVEPLERPAITPLPADSAGQSRPQPVDAGGLATRIGQVINAPVAADKPEEYVEAEPPAASVASDDTVHFLGVLLEPNRRLALLKVGDRQRLVGAGDTFALSPEHARPLRIMEVTDDYVSVDDGTAQHRIERTARQASAASVTYISGSTPSGRPTAMPSVGNDPTTRSRGGPIRPNAGEGPGVQPPVVPPPGARLTPADRRRPGEAGEHQ